MKASFKALQHLDVIFKNSNNFPTFIPKLFLQTSWSLKYFYKEIRNNLHSAVSILSGFPAYVACSYAAIAFFLIYRVDIIEPCCLL